MTDQTSSPSDQIRPDDLMAELGIKKDTYYADLNYLGFKATKDENGKSYLTNEQADLVRQLRSHVASTGKREGFQRSANSALVQVENDIENDRELATSSQGIEAEIEIPEQEYAKGFDDNALERLIKEAAHLKMQNLAAPHLIKLHLAEQMTEEDLPQEMREKVVAVREAASPKKFQPANTATSLLTQWRNRSGNS